MVFLKALIFLIASADPPLFKGSHYMGDTLAAEQKTPAPTPTTFTEFNVRQDSGSPHFIRLCDEVVQKLESDSAIKKGEAFGILLGTIESDKNCTITVEDFEPAGIVEQHIRAWTPQPGSARMVVGYYRSHLRTFTLDEADRALFERCFPKDARVALLVKPPKPGPGVGTFFLGENGALDEARTTVEFPFDLRQLTAEEPLPEAPPPETKTARSLFSGMFPKIAISAGLAVVTLVALSALGVFGGSSAAPASVAEPMEFPKPQPPAPPAISPSTKKAAAPAVAEKIVPKPKPAPPAPPVQSTATKPAQPVVPEGMVLYTPPYAMRQFAPILSESARQALQGEVVVHVRVRLDAAGAVLAVEPTPESKSVAEPLIAASAAAIKRWKFEPAVRGGFRVPSETVLSFTFRK